MNYVEWTAVIGTIILPVMGFLGGLIINGLRAAVKELREADRMLAEKIEVYSKESEQWRREVPEKYASKADLQDRFNLVLTRLDRMEDKLDRALHQESNRNAP